MKFTKILAALLIASCLVGQPVQGQEKTEAAAQAGDATDAAQKAKEKRQKAAAEKAKKRNEYLMSFVRKSHPELEQLLLQLKDSKPRQYRAAMQGLNKDVMKIDAVKEKDPQRYNLLVTQWSIDSRLKVATAQLRVSDTQENRNAVRALVVQQVNFQIERFKIDRENTIKRLATLKKRIAELEAKRAQNIEIRTRSLIRRSTK